MQYKAYLLAACLAAVLPMQACSQDVTRKESEDMMQEISNSRNMQVWDRLMAEENQGIPEDKMVMNQGFLQQAVSLNTLLLIPREEIQSIELYINNHLVTYEVPLQKPEELISTVTKWPGAMGQSSRDEYLGASSAYYVIDKNNFKQFLDIVGSIRTKVINSNTNRLRYDYRMVVKIKYNNGHVVYLSSNRRERYSSYVYGTIIGITDKPIHVQYGFRDLNILFQYVDDNMIIFSTGLEFNDFFRKWENTRGM